MTIESSPSKSHESARKSLDLRYFDLRQYQFHISTSEEILALEAVVGKGMAAAINNLGTVLLTCEDFSNKKVKKLDADTGKFQELLGKMYGKYTRNDYIFVLNERIVLLAIWKANKENYRPQCVVQIDFMYFLDWLDENQDVNNAYHKVKSKSDIGGNGLGNDAITFLRKLKSLAMIVENDCYIQLAPANEQRERVFRRFLKDRPNVDYGIKKEKI